MTRRGLVVSCVVAVAFVVGQPGATAHVANKADSVEQGADWAAPRYAATRTNVNPLESDLPPATAAHLGLAWSNSADDINGEPAVVGGRLFVDCGDALCAYDSRSGALNWRTPLPNPGLAVRPTSPTVVGNTVYLAAGCNVIAIDATTGVVTWTTPCGSSTGSPVERNMIFYPPVIDGAQIFASTYAGDVEAFDVATGDIEWTTNIGNYYASLSAADGWVYAVINNAIVPIRETDGRHTNYFSSPRLGEDSLTGGAVLSGGRVFAGMAQFQQEPEFVAGTDTNGILEGVEGPVPLLESEGSPAVSGQRAFFTAKSSEGCCWVGPADPNDPLTLLNLDMIKITSFDSGSIAPGWQTELPADSIDPTHGFAGQLSGATVADGVVYVTTENGWVVAASALDGHLLWSYNTEQPPTPPFALPTPVVADGVVYVTMGSTLYAFAPPQPTALPPVAPTDLITTAGDGRVSLAWSQSTSGDAATSYTVTVHPSGRVIPVNGTFTTVSDLKDWTAYRFTITPLNAAGAGPPLLSPSVSPRPPVTIASVGSHHHVRLLGADGWQSFGGYAIGAPAVVTRSGSPYVFALGADHDIWVRTISVGWARFGPADTDCESAPAAALYVDTLTVACRTSSNELQYTQVSLPSSGLPTTSTWTKTRIPMRGTPAVMGEGVAPYFTTIATRNPKGSVVRFTLDASPLNKQVTCSSPLAATNDQTGHQAIACAYATNPFGRLLELQLPENPLGGDLNSLNVRYQYEFRGGIATASRFDGHVVVGINAKRQIVEYAPPAYKWGVAGPREADNFTGWSMTVIGQHARYGVAATPTY